MAVDRRNNYIITNVLCLHGYETIIKRDLLPYINQKYPIWWLRSNEFDLTIKFNFISDGIYIDGFDVLFDRATMK